MVLNYVQNNTGEKKYNRQPTMTSTELQGLEMGQASIELHMIVTPQPSPNRGHLANNDKHWITGSWNGTGKYWFTHDCEPSTLP